MLGFTCLVTWGSTSILEICDEGEILWVYLKLSYINFSLAVLICWRTLFSLKASYSIYSLLLCMCLHTCTCMHALSTFAPLCAQTCQGTGYKSEYNVQGILLSLHLWVPGPELKCLFLLRYLTTLSLKHFKLCWEKVQKRIGTRGK